jgi:hypothetical protein
MPSPSRREKIGNDEYEGDSIAFSNGSVQLIPGAVSLDGPRLVTSIFFYHTHFPSQELRKEVADFPGSWLSCKFLQVIFQEGVFLANSP